MVTMGDPAVVARFFAFRTFRRLDLATYSTQQEGHWISDCSGKRIKSSNHKAPDLSPAHVQLLKTPDSRLKPRRMRL